MRKFSLTRFDDVHGDDVYLYLSVLSLLFSYLNICIILGVPSLFLFLSSFTYIFYYCGIVASMRFRFSRSLLAVRPSTPSSFMLAIQPF